MKRPSPSLLLFVLVAGALSPGCGDHAQPTDDAAAQPSPASEMSPRPAEGGAQAEVVLDADLFTKHGPFSVGFQRHETSYAPLEQADLRTLRVVIWYPTNASEGEPGLYADLLPREEVFFNAPPALDAPAPVLIFTHGSIAVAEQSWFFAEFFAFWAVAR